jgi:hypothetical protein
MSGISRRSESDGRSVVSLQLARDRTRQLRPRDLALRRNLSGSDSMAMDRTPFGPSIDKRRLLERLKVENVELRDRVIDLALQIQALRDALQR